MRGIISFIKCTTHVGFTILDPQTPSVYGSISMSLVGLAERLRAARAAATLTQGAVASALGYTPPTVANYEHGRTLPDAADLLRLATLYRVSADWLLVGARMSCRFEHAPKGLCPHGVPFATERCLPCEAPSP